MRKQFLALLTRSAYDDPDRRRGGIHGRRRHGAHGKRARRTQDGQPDEPACREAGSASAEGVGDERRARSRTRRSDRSRRDSTSSSREGEDSIFTVLAEFGNQINPTYGGTAGPLHNQIPQPDRTLTTRRSGHRTSPAYYQNLSFDDTPGANSMRNYYIEQSSDRYTVNGDVTNWGRCRSTRRATARTSAAASSAPRSWLFVRDAVERLGHAQIAAGKTTAQINAYLAKFDIWDRYDYDGDGNFNEPDGYIDHFQSIHAGEGEETGGGAQGTDAIWTHRWYAYYNRHRPRPARPRNKLGGIQIGEHRTTGSATTRSSRRTAASACSRTSSATTSACRTSTTRPATPAAPRIDRLLDAHVAGLLRQQRRPTEGIGTAGPHERLGQVPARLAELRGRQPGAEEASQARPGGGEHEAGAGRVVILPDKEVTTDSARRMRARTSTTPVRATTWTTT